MPRKSPVHYIAPSAISIVPNANGSANDLAVFVAKGAKIKVYAPKVDGLGWGADNTYQEWTFAGRNRRLADALKPYTIYARLSKTDKANGYLVFAPKNDRNAGVEGEEPDWQDKYNYVTVDGLTQIDGALTDQNYWYIRLGDVSVPTEGQRTVDLDTGILTTDQYNMEWATNPDDLPLRVEIGCTIGDEDAGAAPYVPFGKELVLTATLMKGWNERTIENFDHWEITRTIGDNQADSSWPDQTRKDAFAESGSIVIDHSSDLQADDFRGAVAAIFTVTAWGKGETPEPEPEPENPEEDVPQAVELSGNSGDSEDSGNQEGPEEEPSDDTPQPVKLADASITIYAEAAETYELVLSQNIVSHVTEGQESRYVPEDGITMRIRSTNQRGEASDLTYGQFVSMSLALEYTPVSSETWTRLPIGGHADSIVNAVISTDIFAEMQTPQAITVRLVRIIADTEQLELTRAGIAYMESTQDTKEREWIFLRSQTEIIFGDESHPEPSDIPGGQVNPEEAATGLDPNKNQAGWVPEGWWDDEHGVDEEHYYEYTSYRDYVHASTDPETGETIAAHWGPFVKAYVWNHYTGNVKEEDVVEIVQETVGSQFISKVRDDIANGIVTFLKGIKIGAQRLFGWDADGNITANSLYLSLEARINEIRSHNNKGSGIFESGWFVTNNHNGHSYLEIDELLVRMKAVFMELEIRKETYSGGNVFYSPAGSVIYRVECYKYDPITGDPIRLDARTETVTRPFTAGGRFLALLSEKTGLFSHKETVTVQLEVDHSEVAFYRCYLIADDGTVQTRNWWHAGDQARCQTFNRASDKRETATTDQEDPNFDLNTYVQRNMDGNRFFWRLVHRTGSKKLEDGKWYDYVDLANTNAGISYVQGSDVPMAGDAIVCIGNRSDAERMNMIMLEVIGGDAPAIKIYKGINSFSLDGRKYMSVSPKKIQIRAGSIEYISDNGMELPPKLFRGAWRKDYRYHYYDEVSCDGSTWLCVIIDGYRWETAAGETVEEPAAADIMPGEGLFSYGTDSLGNTLTDRYYASSERGDGTMLYKVRNYTMTKPSDSNVLWQKEVSAGGSGTRGAFKSRVFCRFNPTAQKAAPDTPTGGDYDNPWPGGENPHTAADGIVWHDGIPSDSKAILWSSVCTFPGIGEPTGWSTPAPETDSATLDLEFSPSLTKPLPPATGDNDTPPTTPTGTKIIGDDTHGSRANGSNDEADWYDTNKDADNTHADWANARWRAERKISNGAYDGEWVITKIKGEDGNGIPGDFQSTAFCRTNIDLSTAVVTGGDYTDPKPKTTTISEQTVQVEWEDGIPDGEAMLWATTRIFYGNGGESSWETPRKMMDTQNYDVEFAFEDPNDPEAQPAVPDANNRHKPGGYYAGQIWFDPILDNPMPAGAPGTWSDMVWRAEKETINGVEGTWVITRIKGEKGELDPSTIPPELITTIVDEAAKALKDGVSIMINPQNIIVKQTDVGQINFANASAEVEVYRSDVKVDFYLSDPAAYGKNDQGQYILMNDPESQPYASVSSGTSTSAKTVSLTGIPVTYNKEKGEYEYSYDNGYVYFKVNIPVRDPETQQVTSTTSYWMKVAWYLNRLGNRIVKTIGDIERTYMSRTEYSLSEETNNLLRGTKDPQIDTSALDNNYWSKDSSSYLTVETAVDSPVAGYARAFRIAESDKYFYQIHNFWKKTDTYKFSAYIRRTSGDGAVKARITISQPNAASVFTQDIDTDTSWTYVSFYVTVPGFDEELTSHGLFKMGITGTGTVEILAPVLMCTYNATVIRTDYEGRIESSASGLTQNYRRTVADAIGGNITEEDFGTYYNTAVQNYAKLEAKFPSANILDYNGWEYYTGGLAETDETTQRIYGNNGQNDFCSPAVYLKAGTTHVFSVYCQATSQSKPSLYVLLMGDNPDLTGEDAIGTTTISSEDITIISDDTYQNLPRCYASFTPDTDGYYKIDVYGKTSLYRPQLEVGTTPTAWVAARSKNYSSEINQTAQQISLRVASVERTVDGQQTSISEIRQTSDSISLKVSNTVKENLIMNGTFEGSSGSMPENWKKLNDTGNVSINTLYQYDGHNSVRVDKERGIQQALWFHSSTNSNNNIERVVSGEVHVLKFVARKNPDAGSSNGNRLSVFFNSNITSDYTGSPAFNAVLTDSWQEYTLRFTAKETISVQDSYLYVTFRSPSASSGNATDFLLADVRLTARTDGVLKETGIDISQGRVDVLADNFTVKNISGVQTLGLNPGGNMELNGSVRAKLFYAATMQITYDNYEINLETAPYYTYFKPPTDQYNHSYRVKLPAPEAYEGVELRFFSPVVGSGGAVLRIYCPDHSIMRCTSTGVETETVVAVHQFKMGTLKVIGGQWWTISDGFEHADNTPPT